MFSVWYFYLTWILNICNKLRKEPFLSPLGLTLHFQLPKTSAKIKHLWNICSPVTTEHLLWTESTSLPFVPWAALLVVPKSPWFPRVVEPTCRGCGDPQAFGQYLLGQYTASKHLLQGCGENTSINWAHLDWQMTNPGGMVVMKISAICEAALWPTPSAMRRRMWLQRTQAAISGIIFKCFHFIESNVGILNYVEHGRKYSLLLPSEDVH